MELGLAIIYALLSTELALLIISIFLLVHSMREHRGRSEPLEALSQATRELTRYEYFLTVVDSLRSARREVFGIITGRKPTTDLGREAVKDIAKEIREASRRGVRVRYIVHRDPDRLHVGYLYRLAGAEVRVHNEIALRDLRYMVVDSEINVLGLAGEKGKEAPTRMGHLIRSSSLSSILLTDFERLWQEAADIDDYAKEVVRRILSSFKRADADLISKQLDVPRDVAEELLKGVRG